MNFTIISGRLAFLARLQCRNASTISTNTKEVNIALGYYNLKRKAEVIHQIFGTRIVKARVMLKEHRDLAKQPVDRYEKLAEILKPWKIASGNPNEYLTLFQSNLPVIKANCDFLLECGVTNPSIDLIIKLDTYMALSLCLFVGYAHLDKKEELIQRWIAMLPDTASRSCASERLMSYTNISSSAARVRNVIFASYVEQLLVLPYDEALRIVEEGVGTSPTSLRKLMATLEFLQNLGFRLKNFSDSPQLLRCDAKSISLFLAKYKDGFLNQPAMEFLLKHPEISCCLDYDTLRVNLESLLEFGVPVTSISQLFPSLLISDSYQLKEKIQRLNSYPELKSFCRHPDFPKLLDNSETVVLRVEALRGIDKRLITFTACTCSPKEFASMVKQRAKFRNPGESLSWVGERTGHTLEEIRRALRSHPHKSHLSSGNVKEVVGFLEMQQFTKEQLFNGVQLVLYPLWLIEKKLGEMSNRTEMQPWEEKRKGPFILAQLHYIIEEQYNFTGNGVFAECDDEQQSKPPITSESL